MEKSTEEEDVAEILKKISAAISGGENCVDLSSLGEGIYELPEQVFTEFPQEALAKFTELNLDFNDFELLPKAIAYLTGLTKLSIEGNKIGSLPTSFGSLVNLQELRLNENRLTKIPNSFASFGNLRVLSIIANQLLDFPSEIIEGLTCLEELSLDENEISQLPENFGLLKSLRVLEFCENKLQSLPESFGDLHDLEVLNLSRNRLVSLPSTFGNLAKLRSLDLSDNNLSTLPEKFLSVAIIESLYLDNNVLGILPEWFGELSGIICLSLNDNKLQGSPLSDAFPKSSKRLQKFEIGGNAISHLPESIGELCQLEELHIGSTICELERRNFQNGNWIRELPESFGQLLSVKKLYLDENQIKKLPESFGNLRSLTSIDLGQNLLSNLPDSFCNLVSLEYCQLSKNELICLPSEFGKLEKLKDLRLDSNMLKELPKSCANLHSLHTLDLFNNKLTEVPDWLSKLSSLKRLDLDSNKLKLKLKDIPHLASKGSEYAIRDPNLKDNWRGRTRADKVKAEVVVIGSEDGTNGDDYEEDKTPTTYNEGVLFAAMRRGLSIWRTHNGTDERQPKQIELPSTDDFFDVFEDVSDSSANFNLSGFYLEVKNSNNDSLDDGEDWDKEINESWGKTPVQTPTSQLSFGVDVSGVDVEKRSEFLATLSAYPPASQAYSPTATYESLAVRKLCNSYDNCTNLTRYAAQRGIAIQGQFDDAE